MSYPMLIVVMICLTWIMNTNLDTQGQDKENVFQKHPTATLIFGILGAFAAYSWQIYALTLVIMISLYLAVQDLDTKSVPILLIHILVVIGLLVELITKQVNHNFTYTYFVFTTLINLILLDKAEDLIIESKGKGKFPILPVLIVVSSIALIIASTILGNSTVTLIVSAVYTIYVLVSVKYERLFTTGAGDILFLLAIYPFMGTARMFVLALSTMWTTSIHLIKLSIDSYCQNLELRGDKSMNIFRKYFISSRLATYRIALIPHLYVGICVAIIISQFIWPRLH